ncbi:YqjF family protein [Halobacillus sp. BBL2006]|uniref:YqjF family protein n=1 Tax=Halobacillus sp. BBL2006 TaxID=1543706 RepID=UPI000544410D|nr:DUF2071 domain-containing protein [Halobacillus sp. BBL2006]KHE72160.1 hypothetical protein LD39_06030 [Halobacillus sp. BBL2006]
MKHNFWIMQQSWEDLVFIHWPVPVKLLRPFVPSPFEIDQFDGTAWIAIVPFHMNHIQFRGIPLIPFQNRMLELNVRTYVKYRNETGVYFFSLDADHRFGVFLARTLFGLPYLNAHMRMEKHLDHLLYMSRRVHSGYEQVHFHCSVSIDSPLPPSKPGSLIYWLTERYALWAVRGSKVYKGPILHQHWNLQKAEAEIMTNHLLDFLPAPLLTHDPIVHYSQSLKTRIYPFIKMQ